MVIPEVGRIAESAQLITECHFNQGVVYICGNGGSFADAQHFAAEMMKRFLLPQRRASNALDESSNSDCSHELGLDHLENGIRATVLGMNPVFVSAFTNDSKKPEYYLAQELSCFARKNDLLFCLSTSGESPNILCAARTAQSVRIPVISLTGAEAIPLKKLSTLNISVAEPSVTRIQEIHKAIYHAISQIVERNVFSGN